MNKPTKAIWFVTGSQHLYGPEALAQVASNAKTMVDGLNDPKKMPVPLVFKPVVTTPEEITGLCREANNDPSCVGLVFWMHTFSPAKMWIAGLNLLDRPICHLHTQYNAGIPWERIDMDFMNLNQSAHGDREFGHMMARLRKNPKIVVGHWQEERVRDTLALWSRVALGCDELRHLKVARIGDNMREVAVTEGDKVGAQMRFGLSVNGYDSSDITKIIADLDPKAIDRLLENYEANYTLAPELLKNGNRRESLVEAAKIELALRRFLEAGDFWAFTDTFENLGSLKQLPGIAVQRLMADGYGFGGEGDWKTAALLRCMKAMAFGLNGGTSFMEDYTYHFSAERDLVLGSHMLEICPSIAKGKPRVEVHPLGIGGREDPVRLVFDSPAGPAINASLVDMGNRFRLIVNEVLAVEPLAELPRLPVARVLWEPKPNLDVAATAWIHAGGAHHTVYSQVLTAEYLEVFADIFGIELLVIDAETRLRDFKDRLRANEAYYHLFQHGM